MYPARASREPVWLDEKPCLSGTAAADHQDIFVPGILRLFGAAGHGEPFRLSEQYIVLKHGVYVRLNILRRSP